MFKKKAKLAVAAVGATLALALTACASGATPDGGDGGDDKVTTLRILYTNASTSPAPTWQWLADEIESRSNGSLKVSLSDLSELGVDGDQTISFVRDGRVDIADVFPGYVAGRSPLLEGAQLPGLFSTFDETQEVWVDWEATFKERPEDVGGKVLGTYSWESQFLFTKKPINSLDDLRGLQVRVSSTAIGDYMKGLGASPVSMASSEVYPALQRGAIDAVVTGAYGAINEQSLDEVTKYVTELKLPTQGGFAVMNQDTFDSLSAEQQDLLEQIGAEFTKEGWSHAKDVTETGLENAVAAGLEHQALKAEWEATLDSMLRDVVIPGWIGRAGDEAKVIFNQAIAPHAGFTL